GRARRRVTRCPPFSWPTRPRRRRAASNSFVDASTGRTAFGACAPPPATSPSVSRPRRARIARSSTPSATSSERARRSTATRAPLAFRIPWGLKARNEFKRMSEEPKLEELDRLISMGKQKGFLTYDEVNDALPSDIVSLDQLDDIMMMFGAMDIEVVDSAKAGRLPSEVGRERQAVPAEEADDD